MTIPADVPTGWVCPECKRVWSPRVDMCYGCFPPFPFLPPMPTGRTGPRRWEYPVGGLSVREEPGDGEAMFVPVRDGTSPEQVRWLQEHLNEVAGGRFIVLPPGAKVLPAGRDRLTVRLPAYLAREDHEQHAVIGEEWQEVFPGLQARLACPGTNAAGMPTVFVRFRLTPSGDGERA